MPFTPLTASFALILGGCLWGIYWVPIGHLEQLGLIGASAGIAIYLACLLILSPLIWRNRFILITKWRLLLLSGLLTGTAFSLFTTSLAYTDVIRAILLFYLTPVWATLLGLAFLNETITKARILVIMLAFTGLYVILSDGGGLPLPRNLGDIFALLSGMFWAVGSLGLLRAQSVPASAQMIVFLLGGVCVSFVTLLLMSGDKLITLYMVDFSAVAPYALLYGLYVIPMIWLTIAPARILSPTRVGILLMSEVVVGAISAALLSGELFGMRETIGTILVIAAALAEISSTRKVRAGYPQH